jgi:hypothetical protein
MCGLELLGVLRTSVAVRLLVKVGDREEGGARVSDAEKNCLNWPLINNHLLPPCCEFRVVKR